MEELLMMEQPKARTPFQPSGNPPNLAKEYLQKMLEHPHPLFWGWRDKSWVFETMGLESWAAFGKLTQSKFEKKMDLVPQKRTMINNEMLDKK